MELLYEILGLLIIIIFIKIVFEMIKYFLKLFKSNEKRIQKTQEIKI